MVEKNGQKDKATICKTLNSKLKIEHREPH